MDELKNLVENVNFHNSQSENYELFKIVLLIFSPGLLFGAICGFVGGVMGFIIGTIIGLSAGTIIVKCIQ